MTTFFCMRHGLTEWNRESRIQGKTDISLCNEGRDMAREWAKALSGQNFDCILTSGLERSRETAEIINETLGLPMHEDQRLAEQDWGEWTELTKTDLKKLRKQVLQQEKLGLDFRPPGGESRNEVLMRACDALMDFNDSHPDKSVLVITHNGVIKSLAYVLSGLDFLPGDPLPIKPYCLHRIECMDNELAIGELNMEL
ncbi:MAG: histidine phosphatase family protein [Pseudodesulfovibrio sp.]|nr:histidine phosphatase family protein [Pseudodesulfovibrio sp.]